MGSSKSWAQNHSDLNGLLSKNSTFNPFWDFNHVYLPYCTGDTHTGTQVQRNGYGLYFSGALNVEASIARLTQEHGLDTAGRVILSGQSAGGIGTYENADWLQIWLPNSQVYAAPIAGQFFPARSELSETYLLRKLNILSVEIDINALFTMVVTRLYESRLPAACVKAVAPEQQYRCWDASVNFHHVQVPMLLLENMYDKLIIEDLMLCPHCQDVYKGYVAHFGANMRWTLQQTPSHSKRRNSVWMPSCYAHSDGLFLQDGADIGGHNLTGIMHQWFFDGIDVSIFDPCVTSNSSLPCNEHCRR